MMNSDVWAIILARLPLKSMTSLKLVCKEWKSILESPFLRELFLDHRENSHSSWSLMCRESDEEVMAHYGCEIWGLSRSLCSYVSSFLNDNKERWFPKDEEGVARVVSYTDVGLILIKLMINGGIRNYCVANPISRQSVEIPHPPCNTRLFRPSGLATRVENGVLLGYKVVLMRTRNIRNYKERDLLIYSSETGLWSFKTLHSPLPLRRVVHFDPVSLNGKLYWLGSRRLGPDIDVVVSHDFYAESSDQCQVILFPDLEKEASFRRACTTSQGFLMYMNVDSKALRVWRLKREEWQLLSDDISLPCINTRFDYFPLAMNPFDANTMYVQSNVHSYLASINLIQNNNNLEPTSLSFAGVCEPPVVDGCYAYFNTFVLPRWLYRIPNKF